VSPQNYKFISWSLESTLIPQDALPTGSKRLLEVDHRLNLPVNVPLRFLITSGDVLHA
jgi:heme/copper-type cytochrome/quinol oxidase subunit 2